jgi:hypothetical protein
MPTVAETFPTFFLSQGKRRQAIINGNMEVWQKGTNLLDIYSLDFTADMFSEYFDGWGGDINVSKQEVPSAYSEIRRNCQYEMKYECSPAYSGQTLHRFHTYIYDVNYGNGEAVSLGFWGRADRTVVCEKLFFRQRFGTGGTPSSTVTIPVSGAFTIDTTPRYYEFTVILPSTGGKTIGTNKDDFLSVDLYFPPGTEFTFYTTGWQLNCGVAVLPIIREEYVDTLRKCQQYYQRITFGAGSNVCFSFATSNDIVNYTPSWSALYRVPEYIKTSIPASFSVEQGGIAFTVVDVQVLYPRADGATLAFVVTPTILVESEAAKVIAGGSGAYIEISAEL